MSTLVMFEDSCARGHINFVAGVSSDGEWNKLVFELTDALVDLKWEGRYLTERAEMVLTVVSPGVLNYMLRRTVQRLPPRSAGTALSTTIGAFIQ